MEILEKIIKFISGSGTGDGSGTGTGTGSGTGSGTGDGSGYGYGSGYGDIKIKTCQTDTVFYVDNIPTLIDKIKGNIAKCRIVNIADFTTKSCYLAKNSTDIAHGDTLRHAINAVMQKSFAKLNLEEKINKFIEKFKANKKYAGIVFFNWHHTLTGSCESGREWFIKNHNIDVNQKFTVKEFIDLCRNDYGSEVIKKLEKFY